MKTFSLSDLNRQSGEVVDAAMAGPVSLTKRGKPKLVMMPYEVYERLNVTRAYTLENAPDSVNDELMEALNEILGES
jgi:prevent-host-death family protein